MHSSHKKHDQGFTLIELMIGLAVTSIIVVAGFTVLTTTDRSTKVNEQAAGTQQNVRLAMELIARDVKLAGFRMPLSPNVPVGGTAGNCGPGGTPSAIKPVDKVSAHRPLQTTMVPTPFPSSYRELIQGGHSPPPLRRGGNFVQCHYAERDSGYTNASRGHG